MKYMSLIISFLLTVGCSRSFDLGDRPSDSVAVNASDPTWDNGIGEVIATKCVICHTPANLRSKFVPGNTPNTVDGINVESFFADAAMASLVERRVFEDTETPMPPKFATPLSTDEKTALAKWLATKTVNVEAICGTTGTSSWTFVDASAVLTSDCGSCHNGSAQVAFDSTAKAKTYRLAMIQYLNAGTMPPSDSSYKITASGAKLLNWLCFGSEFL